MAPPVHPRSFTRCITAWAMALLLSFALSPGEASAAVDTRSHLECIVGLNKGAGKVMKAQGREVLLCIKSASRERLLGTLEDCLTDDLKGKVAKELDKLAHKVGGFTSCQEVDPPDFGYSSARTGWRASIDKELRLVHSIFGSDLDSGVIVTDKPGSKCQQGVWKAVQKCQDTKIKEFNKCKKDGLKGKTPPGPINSGTDLERLCLQSDPNDPTTPQPDPKGKILKKCLGGIQKAIDKKCSGLVTAPLFPGCAGPVSQACLDTFVECEVCRALNEIDVLIRDCDEFDDGIANGSCPDISLCGPCTSDSQCPTVFVCNVGDICLQSCQCPLCAVCAGNCVLP